MRYVLDSSVGFKWGVTENDSDKALRLRDDARAGLHSFLAPDFFPVELAHSITRAERQKRITPAEGAAFVTAALTDLPTLLNSVPLLARAYALSSAERTGLYDCVYVALAEREGCELVTADDRLVKNLGQLFPFIIPLSSLP
jgi:predicted nucleic acid-binding protein